MEIQAKVVENRDRCSVPAVHGLPVDFQWTSNGFPVEIKVLITAFDIFFFFDFEASTWEKSGKSRKIKRK